MTTPIDGPFAPPNIIIPNDWTEAQLILSDYLIRLAEAVNSREISQYQSATLSAGENISLSSSGERWFTEGDATKFRAGLRTVVNFGALPNTATASVPHGINVTANTVFTDIRAVASIPGVDYIVPDVTVDATNVNITTASDLTAYTQCYVTLEWVEST